MNRQDELDRVLDRTLDKIRREEPEARMTQDACARVWEEVQDVVGQVEPQEAPEAVPIQSCADFGGLLADYLDGRLAQGRRMLVQDHLGECVTCRRSLKQLRTARSASPGKPAARRDGKMTTWAWRLAAAAVLFVAVFGLSVQTDVFSFETGGVVRIKAVDGELMQLGANGTRILSPGEEVALEEGDVIRTAKDTTAMLTLADKSQVEMRERSELAVLEKRSILPGVKPDGVIRLGRGGIIVEASDQGSGHLYVDTDDCRVGVTGTVFSVSNGTKGSRVSVIEGEVHVDYAGNRDVLQPGQQTTTSPALTRVPVEQDIAWSRNLTQHLELLEEVRQLGKEIDEVLRPGARYSTALLDVAPADTVVYIALPNLSEGLGDAYRILQERIDDSEALRAWWEQHFVRAGMDADVEELVEKIRTYGEHLGEEVVVTLQRGADGTMQPPLIFAEIDRPETFVQMLRAELDRLGGEEHPNVWVFEENLPTEAPNGDADSCDDMYLLTRGGLLVATPKFDRLTALGGEPGRSAFRAQLAERYAQGVEWLVGVDFQSMLQSEGEVDETLDQLGFGDVSHLIAEREVIDGNTENRAVLVFDGPRQSMAAWLAEPAPMGAIEFISPSASVAAAAVMQDMGVLVNELFDVLARIEPDFESQLAEFEREHGIDVRRDIAAPLGGEFALAMDGALLPVPAWKLVVEVYDSAKLQQTLEWVVEQINAAASDHGQEGVRLVTHPASGGESYELESLGTGLSVHYLYRHGYLVAAPSRAGLQKALQSREMGIGLTAAPEFLEHLPRDGQVDFSAMLYQNAGPVVGPLSRLMSGATSSLTPEQREMVERLGRELKPSLAVVYGEPDRIVFVNTAEGGLLSSGLNGLLSLHGLVGMQESLFRGLQEKAQGHHDSRVEERTPRQ